MLKIFLFAGFTIIAVLTLFYLLTGKYSYMVNAVTDGLAGYWKLNETVADSTVADSSGDGHDGDALGTPGPQPDSDVPSLSFNNPQSLAFAGADYVEIPDADNLDVGVHTISLWVKLDSLPGTPQTLLAKWQEDQKQQYLLQIDTDGTVDYLTDDGTDTNPTELSSVTVLSTGTWYHIAATITGTTRTLYINGNGDSETDTGVAVGNSDIPVSIGANQNSSATYTNFLNGNLDDIRFYNRILSEDEINILASGSELNISPSALSIPVLPFSEPKRENTGHPQCTDRTPVQKPDLFQADAEYTSVSVYFTTTVDGANAYEIYYGEGSSASSYSTRIPFKNEGWVTKVKIASLSANQPYYFKVRAANGCTAGDFSNVLQVKTLASSSSAAKKYYKSVVSRLAGAVANPLGTGCQYVIKGGDSYWSIAKNQLGDGRKYLLLMAQNPALAFRTLRPGMIINISCS